MKRVFSIVLLIGVLCTLITSVALAKVEDEIQPRYEASCPYYGIHQGHAIERLGVSYGYKDGNKIIVEKRAKYTVCRYLCDCGEMIFCQGSPETGEPPYIYFDQIVGYDSSGVVIKPEYELTNYRTPYIKGWTFYSR